MTQWEIGWLAGIIDADGFIGKNDRNGCVIRVGMCDKDIIERLQKVTGVGTINGPYYPRKGDKAIYRWGVGAKKDVARILLSIYPVMSQRRQETISAMADRLKTARVYRKVDRP